MLNAEMQKLCNCSVMSLFFCRYLGKLHFTGSLKDNIIIEKDDTIPG